MSAGCVRCGVCCDPVQFSVPNFEAKLMETYDDRWRGSDDPAWITYYADIDWILAHWHDNGDTTATCDAFDPVERLCTAHDERPPICANYPWYGEPGVGKPYLHPECSYQADLRPGARDPDWQPIYMAVGKNLG